MADIWSHERFILRNRSSSDDDVIVAGAWRPSVSSAVTLTSFPPGIDTLQQEVNHFSHPNHFEKLKP
ncbi:hypothetical protein EYF80_051878 [Liparis tanakae]|uniref:Uncharacterized protein n=1 Tax=Liparis tanakae TaxID=230148 RepID=A0A4Z2F9T0_9TELE|nr:hypothetical protein EYF80_051878 [Liparis tanakae]